MQDDIMIAKPLSKRKELQEKYGTRKLPYQDLCYATWVDAQGNSSIVDLIGTDEEEQIALLSSLDERNERIVWIAQRNQSEAPSTWRWTAQQMEQAERNPIRIEDSENNFEDDANNARIEVAPINRDRRTEILMLGQVLKKSEDEVRQRLRTEGLDDTLPQNYRTTEGLRETEPALEPVRLPVPEKRSFRFSRKRH